MINVQRCLVKLLQTHDCSGMPFHMCSGKRVETRRSRRNFLSRTPLSATQWEIRRSYLEDACGAASLVERRKKIERGPSVGSLRARQGKGHRRKVKVVEILARVLE
jgi:hypothetical protein